LNFLRTMAKEKLQKVVLVAIVTLIAVAMVGYLYVGAQISAWTGGNQQIAKLKGQIQQTEDEAKLQRQNKQLCEQVTAFLNAQRETMVTGDPFSWVVRQVSLLGEQHPVRVVGMTPGGRTQYALKPRYYVFTTHIDVDGSYDQLGAFIADLENRFPTAEILSLALEPTDANEANRRATIELGFLIRPDSDLDKTAGTAKEEPKKAS
jgi:Tfp pilus assembly protein PilO